MVILNIITLVKIFQALSFVNFTKKYKWVINNTNLDAAEKLGLTGIKKY